MDAVGAVGAGDGVVSKQTGRIEWLSQTGALVDMEADFLRYYHALDPYRAMLDAAPQREVDVGLPVHARIRTAS
jgi:hypothetical protein